MSVMLIMLLKLQDLNKRIILVIKKKDYTIYKDKIKQPGCLHVSLQPQTRSEVSTATYKRYLVKERKRPISYNQVKLSSRFKF